MDSPGASDDGETHPKVFEQPHSMFLKVEFPSAENARIAHTTLAVDKEISENVTKQLSVEENVLIVSLKGRQLKNLRASLSSFMDMLLLTCETIDRFAVSTQ